MMESAYVCSDHPPAFKECSFRALHSPTMHAIIRLPPVQSREKNDRIQRRSAQLICSKEIIETPPSRQCALASFGGFIETDIDLPLWSRTDL